MNRLYFIIIALLISYSIAQSQITAKGNFVMGATLGFSTANSEVQVDREGTTLTGKGIRATQFNIAPAIGYFIVDQFAIGIGLDYTLNRIREPADITDPNTNYERENDSNLLFGPFTRYYLPVGRDKAFFLEGTFGFGSSQDQLAIDGQPQTISNDVLAGGGRTGRHDLFEGRHWH